MAILNSKLSVYHRVPIRSYKNSSTRFGLTGHGWHVLRRALPPTGASAASGEPQGDRGQGRFRSEILEDRKSPSVGLSYEKVGELTPWKPLMIRGMIYQVAIKNGGFMGKLVHGIGWGNKS